MTSTTAAPPPLASSRDVMAAIVAMGLVPPDPNAMAAIQRNCRDSFLERLSSCVSGQDTEGKNRKAIEGLLLCLTTETGEAVRSLGFMPTFNALALIGNKSPAKFLSAIPIAKDPSHPRHADAKAFLMEALTSAASQTSSNSSGATDPASSAPAPAAANVGLSASNTTQQSMARSAPRPSQQDVPTQSAPPLTSGESPSYPASTQPVGMPQAKDYISQHVYGSGYALCFNAGEWSGKPGVMVDAATSDGPKSYDWKGAVHVWLDAREIAAVLAVFRKRRPSVEFSAHGAQNDKSFSLAFQGAHFYAKVAARNKGVRAVKILPTDAIAVSVLFLRQLGRAYPDIPLDTVLELAMTVNEPGGGQVQSAA